MKRNTLVILFVLFFCITGFSNKQDRKIKNPVFLFNNALNRYGAPKISIEEQATLVKQLGFDGMEFKEAAGLEDAVATFKRNGLKIYTDYMKIGLDQKDPYLPEWKTVIPKLKGSGIIVWIHIHSQRFRPSDEAADKLIVPIVQELADFAGPYGVRLAIYPHVGFLAEKSEDAFRLAKKINRDNVGAVFNLCHFLRTDSEENLEQVLTKVLPKLFAVSISGADGGDTQKMGWDRLIRPLGEGNFDVYRVVEFLADNGFDGPIGIQCYNLKGEPEEYLSKTMKAWTGFKEKYSVKNNKLSYKEKQEGWKLLFNGKSVKQWRGINQNKFPSRGWEVKNGELITDAFHGAESANGGDIITKNKYSDFVIKWEWKIMTKGGNSGLKYFVREGIGENKGYGFGLEYQILDDKNHPWMLSGKMQPNDFRTVGSLYEIYAASADKKPSPLGLWNESKIVSKGKHVEHWLNGKIILEYERGSSDFIKRLKGSKFKDIKDFGIQKEGYILLQDHGSEVHFRNIKIKTN